MKVFLQILLSGLMVNSFIGGFPEQNDKIHAANCQIAVGAPGRIKSLIKKKILNVNSVKLFVLDEADKLMEKSFENDVNEIYRSLPLKKQIIATSATYPNNLEEFLKKYMQSPTYVGSENENQLLLGLKHFIREVKPFYNVAQEIKFKNEELLNLLSNISFTQCIIFSNYQTRAENISITLNRNGWDSIFISSAQSQTKRLEAIEKLKNFKCRILLSTDLTSRGIDASNIDLVINYDIPFTVSTYLHRMGRAGRYGSRGVCITLVSGDGDLLKIRKFLGNIGGTNLTVSKLSDIENGLNDLWLEDDSKFIKISGMIDGDADESNSIKNELLSMKNSSMLIGKPEENSPDFLIGKLENKSENDNEMESDYEQESDNEQKSDIKREGGISEFPDLDENPNSSNVIHGKEEINLLDAKLNKKNSSMDKTKDHCNILQALANKTFDFTNISNPANKFSMENFKRISKNEEKAKLKEKSCNSLENRLKALADGTFDFNEISGPMNMDTGVENHPCEHKSENPSLDCILEIEGMNLKDKNVSMIKNDVSTEKYEKIRKSSELDVENNSKISKNEVYIKNKGIYEIARILTNQTDFNSEVKTNLESYLKVLKKQNTNKQYIPTENKLIEPHKNNDTSSGQKLDIFNQAYLYSIEKSNDHWKCLLNDNELQVPSVKNVEESPNNSIDYMEENCEEEMEEEYEELIEYDYEEVSKEDFEAEYDENGYEDIPNRMVWVPVGDNNIEAKNHIPQINIIEDIQISENVNNPITNENFVDYSRISSNVQPQNHSDGYLWSNDHFKACFDQCSNQLEEENLSSYTLTEFQEWYTNNWLKRLDEARNYVIQNVYVREMSSFQYTQGKF